MEKKEPKKKIKKKNRASWISISYKIPTNKGVRENRRGNVVETERIDERTTRKNRRARFRIAADSPGRTWRGVGRFKADRIVILS